MPLMWKHEADEILLWVRVKKQIYNSSAPFLQPCHIVVDIKGAIKHTTHTHWWLNNGSRVWMQLKCHPDVILSVPPLCNTCLCSHVVMCVCTCVSLCVCGLRGDIMWKQEPCDSFAGCQSVEAFPLGCSQNRINTKYLAALVTETWAAPLPLTYCWSICQYVNILYFLVFYRNL